MGKAGANWILAVVASFSLFGVSPAAGDSPDTGSPEVDSGGNPPVADSSDALPLYELYGPERPMVRQTVPMDRVQIQYHCYQGAYRAINAAADAGRLPPAPVDRALSKRRTCAIAALCDTVDGEPDYFTFLLLMGKWFSEEQREKDRDFVESCKGVESWGRDVVRAEPEVFRIVISVRDKMQAELPPN